MSTNSQTISTEKIQNHLQRMYHLLDMHEIYSTPPLSCVHCPADDHSSSELDIQPTTSRLCTNWPIDAIILFIFPNVTFSTHPKVKRYEHIVFVCIKSKVFWLVFFGPLYCLAHFLKQLKFIVTEVRWLEAPISVSCAHYFFAT